MAAVLAAACSCDPVDLTETAGEGSFSLRVNAEKVVVGEETRATVDADVNEFLIYLVNANGDKLIDGKKRGNLNAADYNVQSAAGYTITAKSCVPEETTMANDGWGAPYFMGETTFGVTAGATTPVSINCTLQNAGIVVEPTTSFTDKFPIYAITTNDARSLVWDSSHTDAIAYYDMTAEIATLELKVTGSKGGWEDRLNKTFAIELQKGKVCKVTLQYDDNSGNIDIGFETDKDINTDDSSTTVE